MKHLDQSLQRLFKAAAQTRRETPEAPSFALEAATLAQWRAAAAHDESALLAILFRRAVICASLVMLASIGWSRLGDHEDAASAGVIAHYEIAMEVLP
jgi:hypothetical protein